ETIDYGPCAFMDTFNPAQVYSFIDKQGRYAWGNQPRIASWNLARFAETLLPLIADQPEHAVELATGALQGFNGENEEAFLQRMGEKIGLKSATKHDEPLIRDVLNLMSANKADYSQTFRLLSQSVSDASTGAAVLFADSHSWKAWCSRWHNRLAEQGIAANDV